MAKRPGEEISARHCFLNGNKAAGGFLREGRREIGMSQAMYVNLVGTSGGLVLWWSNEVG